MNFMDNYIEIPQGYYLCRPYRIIRNNNTIVFYVDYIENEFCKRINVNYVFSDRSKDITFDEIVILLESFGFKVEDCVINLIYNDLDVLTDYCNHYLLDQKMQLKVSYKNRNGNQFKELRLYRKKPEETKHVIRSSFPRKRK